MYSSNAHNTVNLTAVLSSAYEEKLRASVHANCTPSPAEVLSSRAPAECSEIDDVCVCVHPKAGETRSRDQYKEHETDGD